MAGKGTVFPPLDIEVVDQVGSTSTELLRRAQRRDIHGQVLAAEWQSAGRGRRGKAWTAVAGGSLTFSIGWRYEQGAGFLAGLSLAVGVAVVKALEAEGLAGVELKWPNDLVHKHLKVGGILVELNGDALGPSTVVVGVGLNVRLPAEIRRNIEQPVSDLTTVAGRGAPAIDRNHLLARLSAELAATLDGVLAHRIPRLRGRVAASPRLSRQAGEAAPARRRQRQGARSRVSTAPARWCSPTAPAARASSRARSRCAGSDQQVDGLPPPSSCKSATAG
jgi:biotin-[acetyl-CoA-carboxylase] ligase BirA-like protein